MLKLVVKRYNLTEKNRSFQNSKILVSLKENIDENRLIRLSLSYLFAISLSNSIYDEYNGTNSCQCEVVDTISDMLRVIWIPNLFLQLDMRLTQIFPWSNMSIYLWIFFKELGT